MTDDVVTENAMQPGMPAEPPAAPPEPTAQAAVETAQAAQAEPPAAEEAAPEALPPSAAADQAPEEPSAAAETPAAEPSNKNWYVVKVQSGREESIKEAIERRVKIEGLEEYFGQIVIPVEHVTEM